MDKKKLKKKKTKEAELYKKRENKKRINKAQLTEITEPIDPKRYKKNIGRDHSKKREKPEKLTAKEFSQKERRKISIKK